MISHGSPRSLLNPAKTPYPKYRDGVLVDEHVDHTPVTVRAATNEERSDE
jgi:hypothetical protein